MSRGAQRRYFSRLKRQGLARDAAKIYLYREVQRLWTAGRTRAEIAAELYIHRDLVEKILQNLWRDPEIQRVIA